MPRRSVYENAIWVVFLDRNLSFQQCFEKPVELCQGRLWSFKYGPTNVKPDFFVDEAHFQRISDKNGELEWSNEYFSFQITLNSAEFRNQSSVWKSLQWEELERPTSNRTHRVFNMWRLLGTKSWGFQNLWFFSQFLIFFSHWTLSLSLRVPLFHFCCGGHLAKFKFVYWRDADTFF